MSNKDLFLGYLQAYNSKDVRGISVCEFSNGKIVRLSDYS
jgi:hypothetical protein